MKKAFSIIFLVLFAMPWFRPLAHAAQECRMAKEDCSKTDQCPMKNRADMICHVESSHEGHDHGQEGHAHHGKDEKKKNCPAISSCVDLDGNDAISMGDMPFAIGLNTQMFLLKRGMAAFDRHLQYVDFVKTSPERPPLLS